MKAHRALAFASLCFGLAVATTASADGGALSTLHSDYALFVGQRLVSDACDYHLDMQSDGNLVLYSGTGNAAGQAIWADNQAYYSGYKTYAILQTDGNFVEYLDDGAQYALWNAGSARNEASVLWVQNDGNVVVYPATSPGSSDWWASSSVHGDDPGPLPCPIQSRFTQILLNTNQAGGDIATECTNSYQDCGDLAARDYSEIANSWTWTPPGAPGSCSSTEGQCWIKDVKTQTSEYSGMISGNIWP